MSILKWKNMRIVDKIKLPAGFFWWVIYVCLLAVMLKHTAWVVNKFQNTNSEIAPISWAFAFVFEGAILGFTYGLKTQIENSGRLRKRKSSILWLKSIENMESDISLSLRRFFHSYLNIYAFGLFICAAISGLANFTYAVEFSQSLAAIELYNINPSIYHVSFGWILPVISFLFARVLANKTESNQEEIELDSELQKRIRELEKENKNLTLKIKEVEDFDKIFKGDKKDRITAILEKWPNMPKSGVAQLADVSPAYISQLTKD